MTDNPWNVESMHSFYYLKCPECIFDTQEEYTFRDHAIENHPLSFVLFGKQSDEEEEFEYNDPITSYDHEEMYDIKNFETEEGEVNSNNLFPSEIKKEELPEISLNSSHRYAELRNTFPTNDVILTIFFL